MIAAWPCPAHDGTADEFALTFDRGRPCRLLIVPALFDEANRLRRFTAQTMRALDGLGIDSFLPDLPGTQESLRSLTAMTLADWRQAMNAAAAHFHASHVLALRGGALVAPQLPGWALAPLPGASILRQMIRIRILSSREAGREEQAADLLGRGLRDGLELAGYRLGAAMIEQLQSAQPTALTAIAPHELGGPGLWLRAEPGEDPDQSAALAALAALSAQNLTS